MPNNDANSGIQVAWVGKDRRVVIAQALIESVLGLNVDRGTKAELWAIAGSFNQIQLLPPESELAKLRDSYESQMRELQLDWDATDDRILVHTRLAAFFRILCRARRQSRNFRLTLPPELIDLDLLRKNEPLVLVVVGKVVQLWRRDRWTQTIAIEDLSQFTRQVRDLLEDEDG